LFVFREGNRTEQKEVAMTVFARSDVAAVSISVDHGGCGQSHSRPVVEGSPVKLWALTCHGGCEDVLRGDNHWAGTPHTIPETPDEVAIRMDVEKRGQADQQTSIMDALNKLSALGALPTVLAQVLSGRTAELGSPSPITQLCRNGHPNQESVKFCGECGADMGDAANKRPVAALSAPEELAPVETGETVTPAETEPEAVTEDLGGDLEGKPLAELRAIARATGAEIANSKKEQIANIVKARAV
jgi:hypothetical protein